MASSPSSILSTEFVFLSDDDDALFRQTFFFFSNLLAYGCVLFFLFLEQLFDKPGASVNFELFNSQASAVLEWTVFKNLAFKAFTLSHFEL